MNGESGTGLGFDGEEDWKGGGVDIISVALLRGLRVGNSLSPQENRRSSVLKCIQMNVYPEFGCERSKIFEGRVASKSRVLQLAAI